MSTPITTHNADARARLLMQYRHSPNLAALIDAIVGPLQEIEDVIASMRDRLSIDVSEGAQLDVIGRIVEMPRLGWEDAVYRVLLHGRCAQLASHGGLEEIIGVWRILAQTESIQVLEIHPCQVDLYTAAPLGETLMPHIFKMMRKVPTAGVEIDFPAIVYTATNDFGFDEADDSVGGFGSIDDGEAGGQMTYMQRVPDDIQGTAYVEAGGRYYITADGRYYIVAE